MVKLSQKPFFFAEVVSVVLANGGKWIVRFPERVSARAPSVLGRVRQLLQSLQGEPF